MHELVIVMLNNFPGPYNCVLGNMNILGSYIEILNGTFVDFSTWDDDFNKRIKVLHIGPAFSRIQVPVQNILYFNYDKQAINVVIDEVSKDRAKTRQGKVAPE